MKNLEIAIVCGSFEHCEDCPLQKKKYEICSNIFYTPMQMLNVFQYMMEEAKRG